MLTSMAEFFLGNATLDGAVGWCPALDISNFSPLFSNIHLLDDVCMLAYFMHPASLTCCPQSAVVSRCEAVVSHSGPIVCHRRVVVGHSQHCVGTCRAGQQFIGHGN